MPTLNDYSRECHAANQTWWHDPSTGKNHSVGLLRTTYTCNLCRTTAIMISRKRSNRQK